MEQEATVQPTETPVVSPTEGTAPAPAETPAAPAEETISKAEYESLKKQVDQVSMERNNLRNQIKERELKVLEEAENYKEAYERLKAEQEQTRAELDAERQQREAEAFRAQVIKEYANPKVREAAEKLIAKNPANLVWSEGATPEQARQELTDMLNVIAETVGEAPETPQPNIHPNNPTPDLGNIDPETLTLEELQALLPKADPR